MNKPTLWVMVGLSGSGKSSVAKEIAKNRQIQLSYHQIVFVKN